MDYLQIEKVVGREILDSRGKPPPAALLPVNLRRWSCVTVTKADTWEKALQRP